MAELHKSTLNYYRIRGQKSLLERCIENDVTTEQFKYDFDANALAVSFINDPDSFPDAQRITMTSTDLEKFNTTKTEMIKKKKEYILELGKQAKEKFDLNQELKWSCNETTFKNATFFLSGIFGLFARKIDKDMDRLYDIAASHKTMNKQTNECWETQMKLILSNNEFNRFDKGFLEDLEKDNFLQHEASTTSDDSGFTSNKTVSTNGNVSMNLSSDSIFSPLIVSSPIPEARNLQDNNHKTVEKGHVKMNGIVYNKARLNTNKENEHKNGNPIPLKRLRKS